jgi:competence protein ComEC
MARSLVFITLFYVLGIILGRNYLFGPVSYYLLIGALLWALFNLYLKREGLRVLIPLLLVFLAIGSLALNFSLQKTVGNIRDFDGEKCTLRGWIGDDPHWQSDDVVFPLCPEAIILEGTEYPVSGPVWVVLRINDPWWVTAKDGSSPKVTGEVKEPGITGDDEGKAAEAFAFLSYGQRVSLEGTLYEPQTRRNPGGFSYRAYLETQGIAATFYGAARDSVHLGVSPELSYLRKASLRIKERMSAVLRAFLPAREGNMLVGMLFGERRSLGPEMEQLFGSSGVSHLLAVSGLHVGLIAGFFWVTGKRFGLRGWPACLITILFLFAYVYLTGLKPASLRAFVMIALGSVAVQLERHKDLLTALAAAALFTLLYNPLLLFTVSFQLSYAATASLFLLASPLEKKISSILASPPLKLPTMITSKLSPLIAVSLAAQLGILPLGAYYFQEVSIIALLTNILLLPFIAVILGIALTAALLGLLFPMAGSLLNMANYPLLAYMRVVTSFLGSLPFATCELFSPHPLEIIIYYVILVILAQGRALLTFVSPVYIYLRTKMRPFYLLAALMVPALYLIWFGIPAAFTRQLEVTFLDVGQGDAIFIRTPEGNNILLDGGGKPEYMGAVDEVGHRVVMPFLKYRRVKKLDMVIISHPHEDHFGGLLAVLGSIPVDYLVTSGETSESQYYQELMLLAEKNNISWEIVHKNDSIFFNPSLCFKVLGPPPELLQGTNSDINNNSLVLQLKYKEISFLFTGDIEDAAIQCLLQEPQALDSRVLKVPHHGGNIQNLSPLLEKVAPQAAVITVGKNSFGHPHQSTLNVLQEKNVEIYRTDLYGAVTLWSDGYNLMVDTMVDANSLERPGAMKKILK